ncbi:MAG: VWA domain-containing protein [Bacteroidia bacterium]
METKHQVHNLIILDESGSMESIKKTIIQGFNEIVQTVKGIEKEFPQQEHFISLVSFNGLGQKLLHFIDPVSKLEQIDEKRYKPDATTPLYDAMGFGISKLRQYLTNQTNYNVLVTVLTDGEENASREYSGNDIKKLIEALKMEKWTFTYIGTDHDVEKFALSISITNSMSFAKDAKGIHNMFAKEQSARRRYSKKISLDEDANIDFYKEDEVK